MKTIPVFCLGPAGSYGSEAAKFAISILEAQMPHLNFEIRYSASNTAIFEDAKFNNGVAVVPVENGYEGPVSEVMRYRFQNPDYPMNVVGEVVVRIEHHILVRPGYDVSQIYTVASHPQALGQCSRFVREKRFSTIEVKSTALAAEKVSQNSFDRPDVAAIASLHAGEIYGLKSLGLAGDVKDNKTRFHVYAPWNTNSTGRDRTAFLFGIIDEPGSQCDALEIFKRHRVNLSTNDSVRTGKLGEVEFYLVADMHQDTDIGRKVIAELREKTQNLRILGSFPQSESQSLPVSKLENKKIGIIGGARSLGEMINRFFTLRGMETFVSDLDTALNNIDVVKNSDVIFIAVPIAQVSKVLEEITPHLRPSQLVVSLSSVMSAGDNHWNLIPNNARIHFMSAARGLTMGGRKAYTYVSKSVDPKMDDWLGIFLDELDARRVDVESSLQHDTKRLTDQVYVVSMMIVWVRVMKAHNIDPAVVLEGESPVTDLFLTMLGKFLKQSELYASIIAENPSTTVMLRCVSIEAQQFGFVVHSTGITGVMRYFAEAVDFIGEDEVAKLASISESILARTVSFTDV